MKARILIVDDEPGIRELLKEVLTQEGYECRQAASGEQALQVLAVEPVDLAVVDIRMPIMSGIELFDRMRPLYPDTAVVFLSALQELPTAVEAMRLGACDYITKPTRLADLVRAVERGLASHRRRRQERHELTRLRDDVTQKTTEIESRLQEITALNRLFQSHISERQAIAEASGTVIERATQTAHALLGLATLARQLGARVQAESSSEVNGEPTGPQGSSE